MKKIKSVVIIGSGNVATHLGAVLKSKGFSILQIVSKTEKNARQLALALNTNYTTDYKKIINSADLYLLAITDDAIAKLVKKINFKDKLVVHTSGSINMKALKPCTTNYGVFYPLQTFSKNRQINFKAVPILIEANTKQNATQLLDMTRKISDSVFLTDSDSRLYVHLSAVFANNFSNHMFAIAQKLMSDKKMPFDILLPLIAETALKAIAQTPLHSQTGPAKRNDKRVMAQHIRLLNKNKQLQKIYKLISKNISSLNP